MTGSNKQDVQQEKNISSETSNKDFWDVFEIIMRPISAIATALAIAAIGYYGNQAITTMNQEQQKMRTIIAEREQDARLYTELLSKREESESELRKDMFKEIMSGFFDKVEENDNQKQSHIENGISKKILKMEMLALNFGDSLSLGPLFEELSSDINRVLELNRNKIDDYIEVGGKHQKRLQSLAKRVAATQLSTILPKAKSFTATIPYKNIKKPDKAESMEWQFTWPYDVDLKDGTDESNGDTDELPDNILQLINDKGTVIRSITIKLKNAVLKKKTVRIRLEITELDTEQIKDATDTTTETSLEFTLNYFNFPLIDNTRLGGNERFAIVLKNFDVNELIITAVLFPGVYASQRDKPYLNEAIQDLKNYHSNNEETTGEEESLWLQFKNLF